MASLHVSRAHGPGVVSPVRWEAFYRGVRCTIDETPRPIWRGEGTGRNPLTPVAFNRGRFHANFRTPFARLFDLFNARVPRRGKYWRGRPEVTQHSTLQGRKDVVNQ